MIVYKLQLIKRSGDAVNIITVGEVQAGARAAALLETAEPGSTVLIAKAEYLPIPKNLETEKEKIDA